MKEQEQENASEITDYSKEIEDIFISFMMSNPDLFVRCKGIIKSSYFDDRQNKDTVAFIESYSADFSLIPSVHEILAVTKKEIVIMGSEAVIHDSWFLREFEKFCRHKALRDAILSSPEKLDEGRYGEVLANIKSAVEIALVKDLGLDYYADPKSRLESLKDNKGQVSTGWKTVDEKLYGGLNKGEITIFCGQSGSGKSLFLQNLAVNWAMAGRTVVYLSLELSEALCAMRIDAMHTSYETREVMRNIDEVHMKIRASQQKSKGTLRIKQMPNGCTTNDIRAFIKEYEIHSGKKVDAILVDYLDLMSPMSKKISAENLFVKDKYVTEELRNLAVELNMVTVSASQLNRCLSPDTIVEVEGKGNIEIKDIAVGDKVLSSERYNIVLDKEFNKQHVYKIKTKSGKEIICSANHRFPTKNGITSIESNMTVGDKLLIKNNIQTSKDDKIELIEDEILSIEYIGEIETVDITTDGNHLFFANGILTHNTSYEEINFDPSHIAGGISKVNTADNVIGIFTSATMKDAGRYQIQFMKTRSSSGVGSKVDLAFNTKSLRITDLEDDDESAITATSKGIYDQLKKKSVIRSGEKVDANTGEITSTAKPSTKVDPLEGAVALRAMIKRR